MVQVGFGQVAHGLGAIKSAGSWSVGDRVRWLMVQEEGRVRRFTVCWEWDQVLHCPQGTRSTVHGLTVLNCGQTNARENITFCRTTHVVGNIQSEPI